MTATSTPAPASSSKAAAVSASNCVTRSSGLSVRSTILGRVRGALDGRGEALGRRVLSSMRTRSVKERGAATGRCRCAGRGARRIAAVMRVVEDLPLVPTTWIDS